VDRLKFVIGIFALIGIGIVIGTIVFCVLLRFGAIPRGIRFGGVDWELSHCHSHNAINYHNYCTNIRQSTSIVLTDLRCQAGAI